MLPASNAASLWVLALSAGFGVLLAFALTHLSSKHRVDPVKGAIGRYFYQRLGRRGTVLVIYGTGYAGYGGGQFIGAPATRFGDLGALTMLVNSHAFGWVWIVGGLTGIIVGLRPRRENDGAGFVAVLIPVLVWVGLYSTSCVVGLVTGGESGNPNAWVASFVWLVLGMALPVIAGWPDPETDGVRSE